MDAKKMLPILQMLFPQLNDSIEKAKELTSGVDNSFEGVKSFLTANNVTNEQIDKVANFIQQHPKAGLFMGVPTIVANQIRQLKDGGNNKDTSVAPKLNLPTSTTRRTTKL